MNILEQATPGYLPANFIEQTSGVWIPTEGRLATVGCSDDRPPTVESAQHIDAQMEPGTMALHEGYGSVYGGPVGLEKTLIVAGTAIYGESFCNDIGGVDGAKSEVASALGGLGIPPETFLRAIVLDAVPVRAALTSSDAEHQGKLDPTPLSIGVLGNVAEALDYLQRPR